MMQRYVALHAGLNNGVRIKLMTIRPTYQQLVKNNFELEKEVITLNHLTKELIDDLNTQYLLVTTLNIELGYKGLH